MGKPKYNIQGYIMQVSRDEYSALMQRIVQRCLPDEEVIFELEGDSIIDELYSGQEPRTSSATETVRALPQGAMESLIEMIPLIITTFKLLNVILTPVVDAIEARNKKLPDVDTIASAWKKQLVDNGMSSEKAEETVNIFAGDLAKMLEKSVGTT